MSDRRTSREQRNASTLIALVGVMFSTLCIFGLSALVMPQIAALVLVFIGFIIVGILHYVTWGRWLTRRLKAAEERANLERENSTQDVESDDA